MALSSFDEAAGRRAWYVVAICMLAYILSFIDRQILALLIGPIKADLKITDTQFGLLHGLAFSIFYATLGIPVAGLADRKSRPLVISVGIAVWSVATVLCGVTRSFGQLFLARIFVGAGEAALSPAAYSLISDLFPRERLGRAMAVYSIGSFLGAGIAFLVGGSIIALVGGEQLTTFAGLNLRPWQIVFLIVGAPGVLLALILWLTVKEPYPSGKRPNVDSPSFGAVLAYLGKHRAIFAPHIIGYTFAAMALFAVLGWSPAYLMRTFGLTPATSGVWLGVIAIVAGGGGVMASGWLMDWMTRNGHSDAPFRTGIVGATGAVIPAILLPMAPTLPIGAALLAVTLFFASFPMPPSTAVMQIAAPQRMRSRVSALFLCSNSLIGLTVGSLLVGFLNDRFFPTAAGVGVSLGLVTAFASLLAAMILSLGCRPFRTLVDQQV